MVACGVWDHRRVVRGASGITANQARRSGGHNGDLDGIVDDGWWRRKLAQRDCKTDALCVCRSSCGSHASNETGWQADERRIPSNAPNPHDMGFNTTPLETPTGTWLKKHYFPCSSTPFLRSQRGWRPDKTVKMVNGGPVCRRTKVVPTAPQSVNASLLPTPS